MITSTPESKRQSAIAWGRAGWAFLSVAMAFSAVRFALDVAYGISFTRVLATILGTVMMLVFLGGLSAVFFGAAFERESK